MNVDIISNIFDANKCELGVAPDSYQDENYKRPSAGFVLCRNKDNEPTAVYGQDIWDFNPYRLSAKKESKYRFDNLLKGEFTAERRALVDEAKYLLFCIKYFARGGYTGTLSTTTLHGYYHVFISAIKYCISLNSNKFIGIITLKELFSNKTYLPHFLATKNSFNITKNCRSICKHLNHIGKDRVGFKVLADLSINDDDSKQTPIIPTRLYLMMITQLTDEVESLDGRLDNLPDFLAEFSDRFYGRTHATQKGYGVGGNKHWRLNMAQALVAYKLDDVFKEHLSVTDIKTLTATLKSIQYRMRLLIHLYTGMRDQEVMRLPYKCQNERNISEEFKDEQGKVFVKPRIVKLISTTTKFTGYLQAESWYAAPEVEKAIKVLQLICEGLSKLYNVDINNSDLFLNPSIISHKTTEYGVVDFNHHLKKPAWIESLVISAQDFNELEASDPSLDFHEEPEFKIGQVWPIKSHQFRRSLAYYAASSGFVKLPTLKRQFKHLTKEITRYYSRNFENVTTIFGYYNEESKEFELPSYHTILNCQAAVITDVVDMLMIDLLGSEEKLYGKTGGYVERQRDKLRDGEIMIEDVRKETNQRVDKGELYYRDTLLGGCMKMGKCDQSMLGHITACLTCEDGTIKENKVDVQIEVLIDQLTYFDEGSGEYQVMSAELAELTKYKEHRMTPEPRQRRD